MTLSSRLRGVLADTRPLQNPHYRRLFSTNVITLIGAQLTIVSVPAQIYAITRDSAMVGLSGLFGLVPLVIFGLYGGALADHFDRRTLLLISTGGLIATSGLFWLQAAMGLDNAWVLLIILAVQQAFFAINQPTRSAVIPRLVPPAQLPAANSLSMTVMQFGAIAGPLLGGALIPVVGFAWLYALDTLSLLVTVWAVVKLPPMPVARSAEHGSVLASMWSGLRFLAGHPVLLMSFLVDVIAMVFGMPRILFPELAHESFGGPLEGGWIMALLFTAIPVGAVLGGVFSGWVSRVERHGWAVVLSILVWGAAIAAAGAAAFFGGGRAGWALAAVLVALAVAGAADMVSSAFRMSILQTAASDEVRGRLQGVFIVVVAGGPRVADVVHGAAAATVGTAMATTGGGVLALVGTVIAVVAVPSFVAYRVRSGA